MMSCESTKSARDENKHDRKLRPYPLQGIACNSIPDCVFAWYEYYEKGELAEYDEEYALFCLRHYGFITLEEARNYVRFRDKYGPPIEDEDFDPKAKYLPIMTNSERIKQQTKV
jgi:hypothetical protein